MSDIPVMYTDDEKNVYIALREWLSRSEFEAIQVRMLKPRYEIEVRLGCIDPGGDFVEQSHVWDMETNPDDTN